MPSAKPVRKRITKPTADWKREFLLIGRLPPEDESNAWDQLDWRFRPLRKDPAKKLWAEECGSLLKSWIRFNPGRRPFAWWLYTAQEPRKQIGGSGKPKSAVLAYAPHYTFGVPDSWVTKIEADRYPDSQKIQAAVVDMTDPPVFESEATYLDRLGLLLATEKDKADFTPEVLKIDPETGRLIRD